MLEKCWRACVPAFAHSSQGDKISIATGDDAHRFIRCVQMDEPRLLEPDGALVRYMEE